MRIAYLLIALACWVGPARADLTTVRFDQLGTYETYRFAACGVDVSSADNPGGDLLSLAASGMGLDSPLGSSITELDGGEAINFAFPAGTGATNVSYQVLSGGDQNGSGTFADSFVAAFTPDDTPLGVAAISGVGTKALATHFGQGPIGRFTITSTLDSMRVGRVTFTTPPQAVRSLLLEGFGNFSTASFASCGVSITGSNTLSLNNAPGGLGVISGVSDPSFLNGFEWVEVEFAGPRNFVSYSNVAINDDSGNGIRAESFLQAFDADGSLGIVAVDSGGPHPVSAAFGNVPITGFRVTADVDAQWITEIRYTPEAEGAALAAAIVLGLAIRRRFRGRSDPGVGGQCPRV